mmetsp:Transcript_8991/g.6755  ORF Transcript_8991/g.6755 Transcript_8991/m.6755 type:complete len:119 (+) Transcript_8991:36-392(+)
MGSICSCCNSSKEVRDPMSIMHLKHPTLSSKSPSYSIGNSTVDSTPLKTMRSTAKKYPQEYMSSEVSPFGEVDFSDMRGSSSLLEEEKQNCRSHVHFSFLEEQSSLIGSPEEKQFWSS